MPVSLTPKLVDSQGDDQFKHIKVSDFMTRDLITVTPEMDIYKAIDLLIAKQISGTPVVDKSGKLIGMLSEKDCIKLLAKRAYHNQIGGTVKEYMTNSIQTVPPDMELVDLAEKFASPSFPFRRLPVVDQGRLVGQISRRDVLIAIQKNHKTAGA